MAHFEWDGSKIEIGTCRKGQREYFIRVRTFSRVASEYSIFPLVSQEISLCKTSTISENNFKV